MGLILSRLSESAGKTQKQDALTTALHSALLGFKAKIETAEPVAVLQQLVWQRQEALKRAKEAGQLDKEKRDLTMREINALEGYRQKLQSEDALDAVQAMEIVRGAFGEEVACRKALGEETGKYFDNAFRFLEETFGQSQELVIFVTEITSGHDTSWFVENFGCDAYFRHNKNLLFDDTRHRIREQISAAKAAAWEETTNG
jgi:uncharacterized protein YqeY